MTRHRAPVPVDDAPAAVVCVFGSPWGRYACGPCAKCRAYLAQQCRTFRAAVRRGEYDARGYKLKGG